MEHAVIDDTALAEFEDSLGRDDAIEIVTVFLTELEGLCESLKEAVANNNEEAARTLAHQIKGCAGNVCATQLAYITGLIEGDPTTHVGTSIGEDVVAAFSALNKAFAVKYNL